MSNQDDDFAAEIVAVAGSFRTLGFDREQAYMLALTRYLQALYAAGKIPAPSEVIPGLADLVEAKKQYDSKKSEGLN